MPIVTVQMLAGRTLDQKRALVQGITDAVVTHAGVGADHVWVVLDEVPHENWGSSGQLMADQRR